MKRFWNLVVAGLTCGGLITAPALAGPLPESVRKAAAEDAVESGAAVSELRRRGPEALDELFRLRDELAAEAANTEQTRADLARLDVAIDRVGGQRYCTASRLYWHTDWESAQAAARASGKPVLSLRMLGKLTDEFSCANSRFFRTTLYANREVAQFLRENFVLHWKSVRPVPKVTVDFGDGRKLERTIAGNSIHYVLTADGDLLDGLPGLYSPQEFLLRLTAARQAAVSFANAERQLAPLPEAAKKFLLEQYHTAQLAATARAWQADLQRVGEVEKEAKQTTALGKIALALAPANAPPPAEAAARIARPKSLVELPVLRNVTMRLEQLNKETDDDLWRKIAALHEAKLDDASQELIRRQNPTAAAAARTAATKARTESPLVRLFANLQTSIALDTVRNEYLLHRRIHEWLAEGFSAQDVEHFNERVYAELFLTPSSDPWLGLVPPDVYSALENNGIAASR